MSKAFRIIFVAVPTAAYLSLAIAGIGGINAFFSHKALIVVAITLFAMAVAAVFTSGSLSSGVREDRSNRWVILAFSIIGLLQGYLPAYADRKDIWTLDGEAIRWLGVIFFVIGGSLRLWPVYVLGHRFSGLVAIQPDHSLVTHGIYAVVRHPSYLGLIINSIGWALAFRSGLGLFLTLLLAPPLLARMNAEERLLREQFLGDYDAYSRRTARLIPGIY